MGGRGDVSGRDEATVFLTLESGDLAFAHGLPCGLAIRSLLPCHKDTTWGEAIAAALAPQAELLFTTGNAPPEDNGATATTAACLRTDDQIAVPPRAKGCVQSIEAAVAGLDGVATAAGGGVCRGNGKEHTDNLGDALSLGVDGAVAGAGVCRSTEIGHTDGPDDAPLLGPLARAPFRPPRAAAVQRDPETALRASDEEGNEPSLLGPLARAPFRAPRPASDLAVKVPAASSVDAANEHIWHAESAGACASDGGAGEGSLFGPSARRDFKKPRLAGSSVPARSSWSSARDQVGGEQTVARDHFAVAPTSVVNSTATGRDVSDGAPSFGPAAYAPYRQPQQAPPAYSEGGAEEMPLFGPAARAPFKAPQQLRAGAAGHGVTTSASSSGAPAPLKQPQRPENLGSTTADDDDGAPLLGPLARAPFKPPRAGACETSGYSPMTGAAARSDDLGHAGGEDAPLLGPTARAPFKPPQQTRSAALPTPSRAGGMLICSAADLLASTCPPVAQQPCVVELGAAIQDAPLAPSALDAA